MSVHVQDAPVRGDIIDDPDVPVDVVDRGAGADGSRLNFRGVEILENRTFRIGIYPVGRRPDLIVYFIERGLRRDAAAPVYQIVAGERAIGTRAEAEIGAF